MRPFIGRAAIAGTVAAVCAAATFAAIAAQPAGAADDPQWTMGGQNIGNSRSNPDETILSTASAGRLGPAWQYTTRATCRRRPR